MGVGGGDGGRVTGKNAAKPVTTVQDHVRSIASVKQLDILDKGGSIQTFIRAMFMAIETSMNK